MLVETSYVTWNMLLYNGDVCPIDARCITGIILA